MILVTHEKLVQETFGLIDLKFVLQGYPVMLKVPANMSQNRIDCLQKRLSRIIAVRFFQ